MEKNARLNEPILETCGTLCGRQTPAAPRLQFEKSDATMAGTSIFYILRGETA
jgi:hypothetical protein